MVLKLLLYLIMSSTTINELWRTMLDSFQYKLKIGFFSLWPVIKQVHGVAAFLLRTIIQEQIYISTEVPKPITQQINYFCQRGFKAIFVLLFPLYKLVNCVASLQLIFIK